MTLSIPPGITEDHDTITAALAYANAGWYVLPVNRATKHAGSVLGKGWPSKSSRDPQTIVAWFAGTDHALALHIGRSGAVAFDVDRPTELPPLLTAALHAVPGPFQSTRTRDAERGHYLYAAPTGRTLGNSTGHLGKGWGEVRGRNGVIVVAPSEHEKTAEGGRYAWIRTGTLPELPSVLADELPDAGDSTDAATDREVKAFLDQHTRAERPELLAGVITQFTTALSTGESRHGIALRCTAGAMREAAAGLYPALDAATSISAAFCAAMATCRDGAERTLTRGAAQHEFLGILSWAIAQVAAADLAAVRSGVDERLPHDDDFSDLIVPGPAAPPAGPDVSVPPPFVDGALATVHQLHPTPDPATQTTPGELDLEELAYEREVAHELRKLRIREEATRRAKKARAGAAARPPITRLDEFLAIPDEPARYRVDGLWPVGGRVVLAAQYKAGKTTMVGNIMRSLVDGTPFLGRFPVQPFSGKVVLLDDELDERMVRRWLRDQDIANTSAAAVVSLRGRLSSFDLLDPETRSEWAQALREAGAAVVVLDCLAPILDALGLSEDKEAGRFLVAFDELLKEAGVSEAIVVHHMGHSGERSRGASRLRDWPDVEWRLVREKSDDGEMDPAAPRYFSAYGRDVEVPESLLGFDASTRRLELAGGSRKDAKTGSAGAAIVEFLTLSPGSSGRQIEDALVGRDHPQKAVREALKELLRDRRVKRSPGPRGAHLHWLTGESSALQDHKNRSSTASVNSVSAGQARQRSALTHSSSISENDLPPKTSASQDQRTQTAGQNASALSALPVRHAVGGECVSASPLRGDDALTHTPPPPPDPRDPTDLIPTPSWIVVDGHRVDPTTGELLDPEDAL